MAYFISFGKIKTLFHYLILEKTFITNCELFFPLDYCFLLAVAGGSGLFCGRSCTKLDMAQASGPREAVSWGNLSLPCKVRVRFPFIVFLFPLFWGFPFSVFFPLWDLFSSFSVQVTSQFKTFTLTYLKNFLAPFGPF